MPLQKRRSHRLALRERQGQITEDEPTGSSTDRVGTGEAGSSEAREEASALEGPL